MIELFAAAGFHEVAITHRYDCFAGTTKERTARRYGVVGVNLSAVRDFDRETLMFPPTA